MEQLDAVDHQLIDILVDDVRCPTGKIAKQLGVSTPTVRRRIERLTSNNVVSLGPVIDLYAAGYEYVLVIGVLVEDRLPEQVADDIATLAAALTVNVVQGCFDIEVVAAVKSHDEVGALLFETLAATPGVASLAPSLALDVWKFQTDLVASDLRHVAGKKPKLDALDMHILDCLKHDVRMSNRKVAVTLDVSEGTIRKRLQRMQAGKQARLTATADLEQLNYPKVAYIGIDVQGNRTTAVCRALAALPEINFVCTTLGRHEIFCCAVLPGLEPITDRLQREITDIPGVKNIESSHCVTHIKNQIELGLIL